MAPASQSLRDLYSLLGVASTTSTAEIESAYRKASLRHHPDKLPNEQKAEGQLRFVALTDAKDTLVDPVRRQQYDRQWAEYQASLHKNAKAKRTKLSTTERKLQKEAAQKRKENFEAMKARWAAKTEEEQRAACRAQPRPAPTGFTSMPQIHTQVPNYTYASHPPQPPQMAYVPQFAPAPPQFQAYQAAGYAFPPPQLAQYPGFQPYYIYPYIRGTYIHQNTIYVPNNTIPTFTQPQNQTSRRAAPAQGRPSHAESSRTRQPNQKTVHESTQAKEGTWKWVNENSRFEPN